MYNIHNTHTLTGIQAHLLASSFPGLCPQLYLRYGPDCARVVSFCLLQFSQKKTRIIEWHVSFVYVLLIINLELFTLASHNVVSLGRPSERA